MISLHGFWPFSSLSVRRTLYDKRISQEVNGEDLGEEFAGYVSAIANFNSIKHNDC